MTSSRGPQGFDAWRLRLWKSVARWFRTQKRGRRFFSAVFLVCLLATALVVAQGLVYGLHDLPPLAREAGFASFAAWLVATFWSLLVLLAERRGARPWCLLPAAAGLALYLVAAGDVVIPPLHHAGTAGIRSDPSMLKDTVAIRWTAEDGVTNESPENSEIKETTARTVFSVVDPSDPGCTQVSYTWSIIRTDRPGGSLRIDSTPRCGAIAPELAKNGRYRVSVAGVRAGGEAVTGEQDFELREVVILSLGDSVASGEGNRGEPPRVWEDSGNCHRSSVAGPRRAARLLQRTNHHVVVAFVHLACTGAWIDGGSDPPKFVGNHPSVLPARRPKRQVGRDEVGLAEELLRGRSPDLVFLSVGANDIGFGNIIQHCFKWPRCEKRRVPAFRGPRLESIVADRLGTLAGSFHRLAGSRSFRDPKRVFVTEYFDPLHGGDGTLCPPIPSPIHVGMLDEHEIDWAEREVVRPLNAAVSAAAQAAGWNYVGGIDVAFRRHGYCAKAASWIVPLPKLFKILSKTARMASFHPNVRGQKLYGRKIAVTVLAKGMFPRPDAG